MVAGLFSALFGVGGGIVIVPLLILFLAFEGKAATGTSLAAIGITALAGTILYAFEGHVDVAYAALVGLPAMGGAITGAAIQQRISARALTLRSPACSLACRLAAPRMSATTVVLAILLGFVAGNLAGFFGVGGGILFVPTLVGLGLSQLDAEATSLLAILPTAVVGRGGSGTTATFAGRRRSCSGSLRSRARWSGSRSPRRSRRTCSAASSPCSCSAWRLNLHGGRAVLPRILPNHERARGSLAPARR